MDKRGQVFLVAALIIIGVVISLIKISNRGIARDEPEAFFDLSDEIGFETKRVLDYGVINGVGDVDNLAKNLLNNYSENIAKNDVAFIYGDLDTGSISAYFYGSATVTAVTLYGSYQKLSLFSGGRVDVKYSGNQATILLNGVDYVFDLRKGQNFYFVISREEDGEKFVSVK